MTERIESELLSRPAVELAALVRAGEVKASELASMALARIEALDPWLNAFVEIDGERALRVARDIRPGDERPFAGVPIAIKNNRALAGWRLTLGSELLERHVASYDHGVVRRLKDAGFVIVGTTTLPELGILPVSEARLFGPTRNPWDSKRTPGGSSGGSAAAVAAGMVPLAHGNDGGGSLRIPAACCGLVGLKPARGRISSAPDLGDSRLGTDGVLTRTVADTAALLDVLAGYQVGDATWAPPPAISFAEQAAADPGRMRIGVTVTPPLAGVSVDRSCVDGVGRAAELLSSHGHDVEEVVLPWPSEELSHLFGLVFRVHIAHSIYAAAWLAGRRDGPEPDGLEPLTWAIWSFARGVSAVEAEVAMARLAQLARGLIEILEPYDALLTPALATPPLPLGSLPADAPEPMSTFDRSGHFTPFTPIFNVTGQPAIALPLFTGPDGLPLGVQLAGRPAGEGQLLALAAQLEAAQPWAQRRAHGNHLE